METCEELLRLEKQYAAIISKEYALEEQKQLIDLLNEVTLNHVMANSAYNLINTKIAILTLAKGKLEAIPDLIKAAQKDFRDVIYWVHLEKTKKDQKD